MAPIEKLRRKIAGQSVAMNKQMALELMDDERDGATLVFVEVLNNLEHRMPAQDYIDFYEYLENFV